HRQLVQRRCSLIDRAELDAAELEIGVAALDLGDSVVASGIHRHEADGLTADLAHERGHRVVGHHDPRRLGLQPEHDRACRGNDLPPVRLDGHAVDRARGQPGRDSPEPIGPRRPLMVRAPEVRVHVGDHEWLAPGRHLTARDGGRGVIRDGRDWLVSDWQITATWPGWYPESTATILVGQEAAPAKCACSSGETAITRRTADEDLSA